MTSSFHDTRWTLVSRSRGSDTQAKTALSELCEAYYAPVVAFLRRDGREEDVARELAHDFFAKLLAGGAMDGADPVRGRFRSYLLAALKRFAADQRDKANAAKRGGSVAHEPLTPEAGLADSRADTPDRAFDRQWALTVLARALARLEMDMHTEGKGGHFELLKPWLSLDGTDAPQSEAAGQLGWSVEAVKVAVHRLRKRFRAAVKAEIAQTMGAACDVHEELEALTAVLRGSG